ncbi:sugar phosphate isomerase/epimerase family protein [Sinorhizobium meliloti]|jgi:sugar phosphate isomerase/epimerase|uniref:sugar phosphate isomerase/epimerase family protein n=1 Tax=Sinorhizobium TaxID=28105 RepID=UPI002D78D963|nr:sugar phosphate isomerase/epimerase [Sinorhizobium meliloti]WRQ66363.1 sugar phosphate isomerase/epimerase [Sinorhizobium meliloti]
MKDVSFQLYSARNFPPFAEVLSAIGSAGYTQVEGYGALYAALSDAEIADFKAGLDRNGLSMPTAHFGLDMLESDAPRVLEIAEALGIRAIYCPYLMPDQRPMDAGGWRAFGARLQAAGKPFRDAGLDFGWHNHDFEFHALADGSVPLDQIFAGGPDLSWEADIAWIVRGGGDPFAWISKYPTRITAVHVKDIAPKGENADEDGWADVGEGTLDWKALIQALSRTSAKYFVAEHDNPSDFRRFAKRSLASIQSY